MKFTMKFFSLCSLVCLLACSPQAPDVQTGMAPEPPPPPLPSWNDGTTRQQILDFVAAVTDPSSPDFVPESERIATFDNDGTLWSEQPMYVQVMFMVDRVRALAPENPVWVEEQPFQAILENDKEMLGTMGHKELGQLLAATHAGVTAAEFSATARNWLDDTRHPRYDQPYDNVIYQPMLEVLDYLRTNGFKTFIVSGGGIEFIRVFSETAYQIPPDQVVGSSIETEFITNGDNSYLMRLPELHFNDDKAGKPVAINRYIGHRPIAAFGNSDGDLQMLQYAAGGEGARLMVLVHHDDAEREYAYDRDSKIGRLDKALVEAGTRGWTVVSMQNDWNAIFPWDK